MIPPQHGGAWKKLSDVRVHVKVDVDGQPLRHVSEEHATRAIVRNANTTESESLTWTNLESASSRVLLAAALVLLAAASRLLECPLKWIEDRLEHLSASSSSSSSAAPP